MIGKEDLGEVHQRFIEVDPAVCLLGSLQGSVVVPDRGRTVSFQLTDSPQSIERKRDSRMISEFLEQAEGLLEIRPCDIDLLQGKIGLTPIEYSLPVEQGIIGLHGKTKQFFAEIQYLIGLLSKISFDL